LNPETYILPNDTAAEIWFRKTVEFENEYWLNQKFQWIGGILVGIMVGFFVLCVIFASLYKLGNQISRKKINMAEKSVY
jgi:hypothetical protein